MRWLERTIHIVLFVFFAAFTVSSWTLPWVRSLELVLDDARINLFMDDHVDSRIVIVDIDEFSLAQIGQWPWSRYTLADLMDQLLNKYQVKVIGLDFVLAEPTMHTQEYLAALESQGKITTHLPLIQLQSYAPEDDALANVIRDRPVVTGYVFKQKAEYSLNLLPEPLVKINPDVAKQLDLLAPRGYVGNIQQLSTAATAQGFFDNPGVDGDGVYRRATILQRVGNNIYPSLALSVARLALSSDLQNLIPVEINLAVSHGKQSMQSIQLDQFAIRTVKQGSVCVPFHSRSNGYQFVSASDVIGGKVPLSTLENKIILVGMTALGLQGGGNTSVSSLVDGVEIHANVISGILDNNISYQPEWAMGMELLFLLVAAIMLFFIYLRLGPWLRAAGTITLILLVSAVNLIFWRLGFMVALAPFLVMVVVMYLLHGSWELLIENVNKRRITRLFGQYVPPALVNEISDVSPSNLLNGEERVLSVLFSDVRDFTALSENLEPDQLTRLMNRLLTPLTNVIQMEKGTIDKYMGDSVMAFWGAPLAQEDHANRAVKAALWMQAALKEIQSDLTDFNVKDLAMGVGINTGTMCVGNMGSEFRMAYTVMGDAVNLGSRLEGLTRVYGVDVLVSEATAISADRFAFQEIDRVRVKGKTEPVTIYQPMCEIEHTTDCCREVVALMAQAVIDYRSRNWANAIKNFEALKRKDTCKVHLYDMYLDRIENLKTQILPEDWDGVFTHTTK